jgi:hypothetical protein
MRRTLLRSVILLFLVFVSEPRIASGQSWSPPIGIPAPSFGINQTAPADPNPWAAAVPGFYYVNQNASGATDASNPYGWPGRPRQTIPNSLPAGSVVELRGIYTRAHSSPNGLQMSGTSTSPVFVRGTSPTSKAVATASWELSGTYFIVENIEFATADPSGGVAMLAPIDRGTLRNADVHGNLNGGGISIDSYINGASVTNAVIYNSKIHDNGDVNATFDQDVHGIQVGWGGRVSNVWIVDNEISRSSGDGIQIASGNVSTQSTVHHIYVGRNVSHDNKQTGMWSKQAVDVIFSQNTIYSHRAGNSSDGACTGFQYAPEYIWFLYNNLYDCDTGIGTGSDSGEGFGTESFFIGNLIHRIHSYDPWNPDDPHDNAAMSLRGGTNRYVVDNTIWDYDGGIEAPYDQGFLYLENNILAGRVNTQGRDIFIETAGLASRSTMRFNLVNSPRIDWGSTVYTSLSSFQSATGKGQYSISSSPAFVNASGGDFHLSSGSPAIDAGDRDPGGVYQKFLTRYGITIAVDFAGAARVQGAHDLGVYETGGSSTGLSPLAPTNVRFVP